MKIKNKKYTKINNAKRKSSYIESKLCKKVTIKTIFCCETRDRGKLVASPSLQATGNIPASDCRFLFYY